MREESGRSSLLESKLVFGVDPNSDWYKLSGVTDCVARQFYKDSETLNRAGQLAGTPYGLGCGNM